TLYGQSVEEYPHVDIPNQEAAVTFPAKDLKTFIRQTVFAVSQMETRPILTGVHLSIKPNEITFTATDSHRLALRTMEINKTIDHQDEPIKMVILQNQVLFYTDEFYFLSRLLSGNYPDTSRLIPNDSQTTLSVHTKELVKTIERAALLSNRDQNNVIRLDTL